MVSTGRAQFNLSESDSRSCFPLELDLSFVMAGHSASKTRVNALMSRPSTSYLLPEDYLLPEETWMPAQANFMQPAQSWLQVWA